VLGLAFFNAGDLSTAEQCFDKAETIDKDNLSSIINRGLLRWIRGERHQAIRGLQLAQERFPQVPNFKMECAWMRAMAGEPGQGAELLGAIDPARAPIHELQAATAVAAVSRNWDYVRRVRDELQKRDANTPSVPFLLGQVHIWLGETPTAEAKAREMLRQAPEGFVGAKANLLLTFALLHQGRAVEAEQAARAAIEQAREMSILYELLAEALIRQGRIEETLELLKARAPLLKAPLISSLGVPLLQIGVLPFISDFDRVERMKGSGNLLLAGTALGRKKPALAYRAYKANFDPLGWAESAWAMNAIPGAIGITHRLNAACAAAAATAGPGQDINPAQPGEFPELRSAALKWLTTEWQKTKQLNQDPANHIRLRRWIHFCRLCPELAPVRDPKALTSLPAQEREQWEKLWKEMGDELTALEPK
jgi:tetratricopeptide (TPR) repeat protein